MPQILTINICGKRFETNPETLTERGSCGILQKLDKTSEFYIKEKDEYFFDRNPKLFGHIMEYFRTGELHLPHDMCGPSIQNELKFWGISSKSIPVCCWKPFHSPKFETQWMEALESIMDEGSKCVVSEKEAKSSEDKMSIRRKVEVFLEHPYSSKAAMVK